MVAIAKTENMTMGAKGGATRIAKTNATTLIHRLFSCKRWICKFITSTCYMTLMSWQQSKIWKDCNYCHWRLNSILQLAENPSRQGLYVKLSLLASTEVEGAADGLASSRRSKSTSLLADRSQSALYGKTVCHDMKLSLCILQFCVFECRLGGVRRASYSQL